MKTIRYGSFETNSSSTHAIVIPKRVKEEDWDMGDSLDHKYDFGREECRLVDHWDEKLAYTYMILKDFEGWTDNNRKTKVTKDTIKKFKDRINKIYKVYDFYKRFFKDELLEDSDEDIEALLVEWLANESRVTTIGNLPTNSGINPNFNKSCGSNSSNIL